MPWLVTIITNYCLQLCWGWNLATKPTINVRSLWVLLYLSRLCCFLLNKLQRIHKIHKCFNLWKGKGERQLNATIQGSQKQSFNFKAPFLVFVFQLWPYLGTYDVVTLVYNILFSIELNAFCPTKEITLGKLKAHFLSIYIYYYKWSLKKSQQKWCFILLHFSSLYKVIHSLLLCMPIRKSKTVFYDLPSLYNISCCIFHLGHFIHLKKWLL